MGSFCIIDRSLIPKFDFCLLLIHSIGVVVPLGLEKFSRDLIFESISVQFICLSLVGLIVLLLTLRILISCFILENCF